MIVVLGIRTVAKEVPLLCREWDGNICADQGRQHVIRSAVGLDVIARAWPRIGYSVVYTDHSFYHIAFGVSTDCTLYTKDYHAS